MISLRDSGKLVEQPASVRQVAVACGQTFPLSLRQFIASPGCPFPRSNRLHIKVLTAPTEPLESQLDRMREVFSSAGHSVEVLSREELTSATLGVDAFTELNDLDVGDCTRSGMTEAQTTLFEQQTNVGDQQRGTEMVVYFVRSATMDDGGVLNGCASHPEGLPGAVVAQIASPWTLAHEVGHVLGLGHISGEHTNCPSADTRCCSTPDNTRLMTGCSTDNISGTPTVDENETDVMNASSLTHST